MTARDGTARMSVGDDGLPELSLPEDPGTRRVLRSLQALVMKHPAASKGFYQALIAEGEAFASTPEGEAWRQRLAGSEVLHRARLLFDFPGLSLLEREKPDMLPSSYVDAIFMMAAAKEPGAMLDQLFRWDEDDEDT